MKFPYKKLPTSKGKHLSVPIIDVGIKIPKRLGMLFYNCLVDSGADRTYFHGDLARAYGLNVEDGEPSRGIGIAGQTFVAYKHKFKYNIGGIDIEDTIYFSDDLGTPFGILGREGFFNHFKICFDQRKETVEIKAY